MNSLRSEALDKRLCFSFEIEVFAGVYTVGIELNKDGSEVKMVALSEMNLGIHVHDMISRNT